jgi:hypothetical protein
VKDALTKVAVALSPVSEMRPHPVFRMDPAAAAQLIMQRWDRQRLLDAFPDRRLPKIALCKVAFQIPYPGIDQGAAAVQWLIAEAPFWWSALSSENPEAHLREIYKEYGLTGRI